MHSPSLVFSYGKKTKTNIGKKSTWRSAYGAVISFAPQNTAMRVLMSKPSHYEESPHKRRTESEHENGKTQSSTLEKRMVLFHKAFKSINK